MNIKIHLVENHRKLDSERIWLKVEKDDDLGWYMILDTTYLDNSHISNKHRHSYWFPNQKLKKGDYVLLYTKKGTNRVTRTDTGNTIYVFYWGLGQTVWNDTGDCAVLLHVDSWTTKKAR